MLSTRDIKRKIRTVRNIQQICRAMKTVSSIKLRKAESRCMTARPYADAMRAMVARLGGNSEYPHPFLQARAEINAVGLIVIGADKGLAGSYNTNVIREANRYVREHDNVQTITLGRKATDAMRREGANIDQAVSPLGAEAEYRTIAALADYVGARYNEGALDRVDMIYTQYGGRVQTIPLLPVVPPEGEAMVADFIYEPNPAIILEQLLPRYLRTVLFSAVISAQAAEHSARVTAMSLATDNADDLINQLVMDYNKSRQAGITRELTDIVGAAEALR